MSRQADIDYLRNLGDAELRGYARQLSRDIPIAQSRLVLAKREIKARIRASKRAAEAAVLAAAQAQAGAQP